MIVRNESLRVGVDVGGTFTDLVAIASNGGVHTRKVASTPQGFDRAIAEGLAALLVASGHAPTAVNELVHGMTVATNAILEQRGARTGLLTTRGFRDVLEIRRLRMPKLYDAFWDKPRPLVDRELRLEVNERLNGRGEIMRPLDLDQAAAAAAELIARGAESIAISLLHAYANPVHEQLLAGLIHRRWPEMPLSLSSDVLPAIREYERTSTTVVNAYIRPVVEGYLHALSTRLADSGVQAPVLIMQSNGGTITAAAAAVRPAYIVESGPAAGVIASVELARKLGLTNAITFDMGGTTAKASLIEDGAPSFTSQFEVGAGMSLSDRLFSGGGYALSLPVIDLSEVGAGGGSIIWIDAAGAPHVGPQSAGAEPGPVCYMKGGQEPTVTDVNVILGYLNAEHLLDGTMPIDADAARRAFQNKVAGPLGLDPLDAAYGIFDLANARMIRAVKAISTHRGRDPRDYALFAFGGGGPVHAAAMAREMQIGRVIIPPSPGLFSAFGLLDAAIEHHAVRSFLRRTDQLEPGDLDAAFAAVETDARAELVAQGYPVERIGCGRSVDVRYLGQSFELTVPLTTPGERPANGAAIAELEEAFGREHLLAYGHRPDHPIEIVTLRLTATVDGNHRKRNGHRQESTRPRAGNGRDASDRHAPTFRLAYFGPRLGRQSTPVIRRGDLPGNPTPGPFIIEEYDATVVVPSDCAVWRDELGNIVVEVRGE